MRLAKWLCSCKIIPPPTEKPKPILTSSTSNRFTCSAQVGPTDRCDTLVEGRTGQGRNWGVHTELYVKHILSSFLLELFRWKGGDTRQHTFSTETRMSQELCTVPSAVAQLAFLWGGHGREKTVMVWTRGQDGAASDNGSKGWRAAQSWESRCSGESRSTVGPCSLYPLLLLKPSHSLHESHLVSETQESTFHLSQ